MSGSTVELNLKTAVDADDTADYLTLSLADSLRTVDALFNNVTGHNHSGSHQGGPLGSGSISGDAIADGAITSAKIADGTIATIDIADNAVTNQKLGANTARANLLTNGGMEIWQRGAGPFTANGAYTADQWTISLSGTDTMSVSRSASADGSSNFAAGVGFTLGSGAGNSNLRQVLKITDHSGLRNRAVTFSARVLATVANCARLGIYADGSGGTVYVSPFHSGSSAYETLSVAYPLVPATATNVIVYVSFSVSNSVAIDNAMLVAGGQTADYAPLHPADDMARCLRYYEVLGETPYSLPIEGYNGAGALTQRSMIYVRKAVTPTATKVGTWTVSNCGQPTLDAVGLSQCRAWITVTATGGASAINDGAGKNITIEGNP